MVSSLASLVGYLLGNSVAWCKFKRNKNINLPVTKNEHMQAQYTLTTRKMRHGKDES
jgi:hypothetical protein